MNRASSEALLLKNLPPFYSESQPLNSLATRLTGDALAGVYGAHVHLHISWFCGYRLLRNGHLASNAVDFSDRLVSTLQEQASTA